MRVKSMKLWAVPLMILLLPVGAARAQTSEIVDSCLTSMSVGTSTGNSAQFVNFNADVTQWNGSSWSGSWPLAGLSIPPPTNTVGCNAVFIGNSVSWTTGGEGYGMLLSSPLVAGNTYTFWFTYVSHGLGANGAFNPQISTNNTSNWSSSNVIGNLPPVGNTWTTNSFTFTATAAQDGDIWLFLHSTGNVGSGLIMNWCTSCSIPPVDCPVDLGPDQTLCPGQTLVLDATTTGASYSWQDGSTSSTFNVDAPGTYWVEVTTGACSGSDTVVVDFLQAATVDLGNDTAICAGSALLLDATTPGATYTWQDGSDDATYAVSQAGTYTVTITIGGCSATGSIDVAENPAPVVDLGPDDQLCPGASITLDASNAGALFTWQDGDPNQTYQAATAGTYWVDVDLNGCVATDTIQIAAPPDAGIGGPFAFCSTDAGFDLMDLLTGPPDAGGSWSSPSGPMAGSAFDPSSDVGGDYTYTAPGPVQCPATAVLQISVATATNAGTDGALTLCETSPSADLFAALGGTPDVNGIWTDPAASVVGASLDPATAASGTYTYTVAGTAPCPDQSAVVNVTINAPADAGSDSTLTTCTGEQPFNLLPLLGPSAQPGGSWTGPSGAPFNGSFNPNINPAGTYTYTVAGTQPCPSATATVGLSVNPALNAGTDTSICTLSLALNATGGWTSGQWSGPTEVVFSDPASSSSTATASAGGTYTLTWSIVTNADCPTTNQVTVTFTEAITPTVAVTDAICNGACDGTASVWNTGGTSPFSYQWSGGAAGNVPDADLLCAGNYAVLVSDANGCVDSTAFVVGEPDPLQIEGFTVVSETCFGDCDGSIVIDDASGAHFSIDGGQTFQDTAFFAGLCPGVFELVMLNGDGCIANATAPMLAPPPVIAGFIFTPETLLVGDAAHFHSTSSPGNVALLWDFSGLESSSLPDPVYAFPGLEGSEYLICLTASDTSGCTDSQCTRIIIYDPLLAHVPNAFTPNDDDVNEGFFPVFNEPWAAKDYRFSVFDRWGELLFESTQVHEPWDGRVGGELAKTEVYVWKARWRDILSGNVEERVGHVTLLK